MLRLSYLIYTYIYNGINHGLDWFLGAAFGMSLRLHFSPRKALSKHPLTGEAYGEFTAKSWYIQKGNFLEQPH